MNEDAMRGFSSLDDDEKKQVIDAARIPVPMEVRLLLPYTASMTLNISLFKIALYSYKIKYVQFGFFYSLCAVSNAQ